MQVNVNLAGVPALVVPCGFVEGGIAGLPVGLQMIGTSFSEVCKSYDLAIPLLVNTSGLFVSMSIVNTVCFPPYPNTI